MIKELPWYDKIQFGALMLMAAAMPITWRLGLWAAILIGAISIVKFVVQRGTFNKALDRDSRIQLYALLAYMLIILVDALFCSDRAEGIHIFFRKGGLLIFAISMFLGDTSYLDKKHLQSLAYALVASMSAYFLFRAGIAVYKVINGATWSSVTSMSSSLGISYFDTHHHHAYSTLYANTAILAAYWLLQSRWKEIKEWHRGLLIVSIMFSILYIILVNSRAGMTTMYAVELACVGHLFISTKLWKPTVIALVLTAGFTFGAEKLIPGYTDRVSSTISNITSEEPKDERISINRTAFDAIKTKPIMGLGVGDYHTRLVEEYDFNSNYNAHNQYTETLLASGIIGLLPLLVYLLWPAYMVLRRRSRLWFPMLMLCGTIVVNIAFESMLERQMGLLFIGFVYIYILLILSHEENKFGHVSKS